jgi:hypothetical protein
MVNYADIERTHPAFADYRAARDETLRVTGDSDSTRKALLLTVAGGCVVAFGGLLSGHPVLTGVFELMAGAGGIASIAYDNAAHNREEALQERLDDLRSVGYQRLSRAEMGSDEPVAVPEPPARLKQPLWHEFLFGARP